MILNRSARPRSLQGGAAFVWDETMWEKDKHSKISVSSVSLTNVCLPFVLVFSPPTSVFLKVPSHNCSSSTPASFVPSDKPPFVHETQGQGDIDDINTNKTAADYCVWP